MTNCCKSGEVQEKRVHITTSTDINIPEKVAAPVPSIKRSPTTADEQSNSVNAVEPKSTEARRTNVSAPGIKKNPTFAEKNPIGIGTGKPESAFPKSDYQNTKPATFPSTDVKRQSSRKPVMGSTEADVWEKAEMAKIIERYINSFKTHLFGYFSIVDTSIIILVTTGFSGMKS